MRRSLQRLALVCAALIAAFTGVRLRAQDAPLAPNVFVRGVQTAQNVRYTASFVKPVETAMLVNVSVEITLPPNTPLPRHVRKPAGAVERGAARRRWGLYPDLADGAGAR